MIAPLLAWLACVAALTAAQALGGGFWTMNLVYGAAIVGLPLLLARNAATTDPLGLRLRPFGRSVAVFLGLSLLTLPALAWWHGLPDRPPPPGAVAWVALVQLVGVALPEELFFRGYLQGAWARARRKAVRVLGAEVGWEWPAASAAFAGLHLVHHGAPGLLTFFPGLLFGWAYARTGQTIWAAVLFHGVCNVAVYVLRGA